MHNLIKIAALCACVGVLGGCAGGVRMEYEDKSYITGTVRADAKIPQLSGLSDATLEEDVNSRIEDAVEDMLEDFEKAAQETGDKSEFCVVTDEHFNQNGFFSVTCRADSLVRTGKRSMQIPINIDTRLCRELSLSDLFSDDGYIDMINARLEDMVAADHGKYAGLWAKPRLTAGQGFYVTENALVLYYPPYELSYYERGFVEFAIPLSDISGYLKPEYRRLCTKNNTN